MRAKPKFEPTLPGLWVLLLGAAAFVLISGSGLPPVVASHFGIGGAVDGFMARNGYLGFILVGVVIIPLLIVLPQRIVRTISPRLISLPNREYWLAPERIESTLDYLRSHSVWFASLFVLLVCFVHWELVQANMRTPSRLAAAPFITGLILYVVSVFVWIGAMVAHFRRRPDADQ